MTDHILDASKMVMGRAAELLTLADRIEAEGCNGQGPEGWEDSLIQLCWEVANPRPTGTWREDTTVVWYNRGEEMLRFLEAGAFLSAADALRPEGWSFSSLSELKTGRCHCTLFRVHDEECVGGDAPTLASALASAALRAHARILEDAP